MGLADPNAVKAAEITIFDPVRPMLAEMANSIRDVLEYQKHGTAFEYKYDGARVQIHKQGEKVRIFSKRLSDVTASMPEIVTIARDRVRSKQVLLEAEVITVDGNGTSYRFRISTVDLGEFMTLRGLPLRSRWSCIFLTFLCLATMS